VLVAGTLDDDVVDIAFDGEQTHATIGDALLGHQYPAQNEPLVPILSGQFFCEIVDVGKAGLALCERLQERFDTGWPSHTAAFQNDFLHFKPGLAGLLRQLGRHRWQIQRDGESRSRLSLEGLLDLAWLRSTWHDNLGSHLAGAESAG
jgi:hypothetical protein